MSRLIVVSNRVSAPKDPASGSAGGLAMALSAALRKYDGLWFGWSGETVETFTGELKFEDRAGVTVGLVDLEAQDVDEYYNGYANKTLWPLFHHRTDLAAYERSYGEGYERTNARFADVLAPLIQPDDMIWIHDYHMIPLARDLRRRGITNRIGFFLHTPWPVRQLLVTLPHHRRLVESMFDYDLIGFHTREWLDLFRDYVASEPSVNGKLLPNDAVEAFGKKVQTGVFPIGIDVDSFLAARNSVFGRRTYDRMAASSAFRSMMVGVDRLDYSKGLEERLLGYEQFLKDNGDKRGEVFLLQVTPISRDDVDTYQDIRARLDALAGRINGEFADMDWQPLPEPDLSPGSAGGHLPRRAGRTGDAAARRDESGGQGIRGGPESGRSGRAGSVALRRRRRANGGGAAGQSVQPRGAVRRHQAGAGHAAGGAATKVGGADDRGARHRRQHLAG
jgi:trehalose 6-phosphate synthase